MRIANPKLCVRNDRNGALLRGLCTSDFGDFKAMGPIFYVMAILGCGEADAACRQVDVAQAQYATMEQCNEATPAEVERRADLAYPVVVAQCHASNRKLSLELDSGEILLPEPTAVPARKPVDASAEVRLASRR